MHTQNDLPPPVRDILNALAALRQPLREKNWQPILDFFEGARTVIKGIPKDAESMKLFLHAWTSPVRHLEIVLEEILESRIEPSTIEFSVRVAGLGRRIENDAPDGIIMDGRLVFAFADGRWRPTELYVDCPPEWAQWNSRPNTRAPIHYGDPSWWAQRAAEP